jgi:fructose 1,6-bisphosphate aldolase/phosphatase
MWRGLTCGPSCGFQAAFQHCQEDLGHAEEQGLTNSYYVLNAGDDLQLLMAHDGGRSNHGIHKVAFSIFKEAADKALARAAGQDLLKTAFAGNICGMGHLL